MSKNIIINETYSFFMINIGSFFGRFIFLDNIFQQCLTTIKSKISPLVQTMMASYNVTKLGKFETESKL